jgi:hypothetical protein
MIGGLSLRARSVPECVDLGLAILRADRKLIWRSLRGWFLLCTPLVLLAWWAHPLIGLAIALSSGSLLQLPLLTIAAARAAGTAPKLDLRSTLSAMFRVVRVGLLPSLASFILLLFPPAAVWIWSRYTFLPEVLLVEEMKSGWTRRLQQLGDRVAGRSLAARFWQMALLGYGALSGELVGQAVVDELFQLGTPFGSLMNGDLTPFPCLGILYSLPIWGLVRFALYLDLRTRSESLDVFFSLWQASSR